MMERDGYLQESIIPAREGQHGTRGPKALGWDYIYRASKRLGSN